jgi:diacylglycerol kinase family enzyme
MKGKHLDNPKFDKILQHSKHKTIEYINDEPFDIGIDGEIISTNHAIVTVLPKAQKIILPCS